MSPRDKYGNVVIKDSAQAMSVQADYKNYVNKQRVDNLLHGIAAVLMSASEMENNAKLLN